MNPLILAGAALGGFLLLKKRKNPGKKRRNPSRRARRSAALKRAIKLRKKWYKLAKKTVKARTGLDSMPGLPDNYSPAHSRWMKQVKKVRRIAKYGTGLTNFMRERGRRAVVGNNPRWARPNENEIPTVRIVRKRNPKRKSARGRSLRTWSGRRKFSRDWNTCEICGRPRVGGMTLMSTGGIDKSLCYRAEYGKDARCKRGKKRNPLNIGDSALASIHGTIGINPRKRRKGRCGATPGAAAARLAKWRWHHNPKRCRK